MRIWLKLSFISLKKYVKVVAILNSVRDSWFNSFDYYPSLMLVVEVDPRDESKDR